MEKQRKQVITYVVVAVCVCVISVLITYSIMQQKNNVTVGLYYGTFDFSEYQNVDSTKKLAIIHDDDKIQGEYEINIEDNDAIANLVYVDGKYLFSDADIEIQKLKRISETAIVK